MKHRNLLIACMFLVFAISATAADVTGKWVAQVPGRDGQTREVIYNLKSEGSTVTGTMSGFRGGQDLPISDGKLDGDNISFVVKITFNDNEIVQNYKGTVSASEMKLTREGGRGGPVQITAKKQ